MVPIYLTHTPAGASTQQILHYAQEYKSGRFCQYDYGLQNFRKYGSASPPSYNLSNVKARVVLHYSDNDWFSSPIDVDRLFKQLPNAELDHVPDPRL